MTEQRDTQPFRFALAAAASKDIVAFAVGWRDEITHVLNEAEHRHVNLVEHGSGFARIDQGHFLRRGDDDRAGKGDRLHDCQLNVAGARR